VFVWGSAAHQGGLPERERLTTDAQALNQVFVSFRVTAFQVLQKAAPPGDHRQQSPAGMMILAMHLEMIHELQNTLAKDRYLNLWRTGVGLVSPVFCDYFVFGIGRQCHARIDTPRLVLISFFLLQHSISAKDWAAETFPMRNEPETRRGANVAGG
jgi:hypothetical protein